MAKFILKKTITGVDVEKALGGKMKASEITIEEDGEELRIILPDVALTDAEKEKLKDLVKGLRVLEE